MTHLPFIMAAYALGVVIRRASRVQAFPRMRAAKRPPAALDTRRCRMTRKRAVSGSCWPVGWARFGDRPGAVRVPR